MNALDKLFREKHKNILSIYFTAGYPKKDDTGTILKALENSGADIAEIGFPFSDPLADGPVIQNSSQAAIKNGINLDIIFSQILQIKNEINIPLILMGYLNSIYKYGVESFCEKCIEAGISGVIIPDLPPEVYEAEFKSLFDEKGIYPIFLISPETSDERIKYIAGLSKGFLYLVSHAGTTGAKNDFSSAEKYFRRVRKMNLDIPLMAGFGIKEPKTFQTVCQYLDGGIIGSAFINILEKDGSLTENIHNFIKQFKDL